MGAPPRKSGTPVKQVVELSLHEKIAVQQAKDENDLVKMEHAVSLLNNHLGRIGIPAFSSEQYGNVSFPDPVMEGAPKVLRDALIDVLVAAARYLEDQF